MIEAILAFLPEDERKGAALLAALLQKKDTRIVIESIMKGLEDKNYSYLPDDIAEDSFFGTSRLEITTMVRQTGGVRGKALLVRIHKSAGGSEKYVIPIPEIS